MGESILLLKPSLSIHTYSPVSIYLPSLTYLSLPSTVRSNLLSFPRSTCTVLRVVSESKPSPSIVFDSPQIPVEIGGGGGGGGGGEGGGGGGGGGGGEGEGEEGGERKAKGGMTMSQKFTLVYAALVGVGGLMGYIKTGSTKSLAAGGISAAVLGYVYTALPTNPTLASAVGLGISTALLGVMSSRFKKSGKVFPAGVVSAMSLVMTAGYLHGIMRTASH